MVSPRTSVPLSLRAWAALVLLVAAAVVSRVGAQELPARIFLQGNPTPQEGRISGVQGGSIQLVVPGGSTAVSLAQVARVEAAAPPGFTTGLAAYNAGNFDKALADLRPIGEKFGGLPTDWAQQTLLTLGSVYLEKSDLARAEAAFGDVRKYYPNATANRLQLGVAQARIAFARNNAAQARQQLDAIVQAALKAPAEVNRADGAAYGQAFYLLARLDEHDKSYQSALENYLRVVTLFYEDSAVTARAQKGADDLRAAHKDVTAP